ncbi:hypothetical protein AAFF_G00145600, partial [Aldrovandia affinis]
LYAALGAETTVSCGRCRSGRGRVHGGGSAPAAFHIRVVVHEPPETQNLHHHRGDHHENQRQGEPPVALLQVNWKTTNLKDQIPMVGINLKLWGVALVHHRYIPMCPGFTHRAINPPKMASLCLPAQDDYNAPPRHYPPRRRAEEAAFAEQFEGREICHETKPTFAITAKKKLAFV